MSVKYIAAYQTHPISAVTHIAPVKEILPYQDIGKYIVIFEEPARELDRVIEIGRPEHSPQGPVYAVREDLLNADKLEDALT